MWLWRRRRHTPNQLRVCSSSWPAKPQSICKTPKPLPAIHRTSYKIHHKIKMPETKIAQRFGPIRVPDDTPGDMHYHTILLISNTTL